MQAAFSFPLPTNAAPTATTVTPSQAIGQPLRWQKYTASQNINYDGPQCDGKAIWTLNRTNYSVINKNVDFLMSCQIRCLLQTQ